MKLRLSNCLIMFLVLCLWFGSSALAETITYTYDNAGRLTKADYGDGGSIAYTYDSNGNLRRREVILTTGDPVPDIKANGQDGPVNIGKGTLVSITVGLNPGNYAGQMADWWVAASTPFAPLDDWYTYVYPTGWLPGINLCVQTGLFDLSPSEVLNMTLPVGNYTFYFAIDDPDGAATGPWWGLDSVEVTVQ